jgi:hypothetical protein
MVDRLIGVGGEFAAVVSESLVEVDAGAEGEVIHPGFVGGSAVTMRNSSLVAQTIVAVLTFYSVIK